MSSVPSGRSASPKSTFDRRTWSIEGRGVLVVPVDEGTDGGLQVPDRGMNAAPEPLSGELCKPALT